MKSFIKKAYPYVLLFILFLFTLLFFNVRSADTIWNYGMAHAIKLGEIPYKDFNIISTPLYPLIMSLGLFIKDTYLVFLIEQAILCVVLFFFIYKLLNKKTIIYFLVLSFPFFTAYLPNYNFLAFLIAVILMYLEKEKIDDKWIGLTLGLLFLTKHTIGIVFIILSLLSTFNLKKASKRLLYLLIPILVFVIYLLITNSLYDCFNLSVLGLFDFGKNNHSISIICLIISILILIYNIYLFKKKSKDKNNYYLLASFSFIIPILNMDHLVFLLGIFLILFLDKIKIKKKYDKRVLLTCSIILTGLLLFNFYSSFAYYSNNLNNSFDKFHYHFLSKEDDKFVKMILDEYQSYDNSYMISMDSMLFDIEANHKITYLDVPLYGNFGYNGINNLKKDIMSKHRSYFFIQSSPNHQYIEEVCDYIRENATLVKVMDSYEIYYIE